MTEVSPFEVSPVEKARAAVDEAKSSLSKARGEVDAANAAVAAVKPEEHTEVSYAKAMQRARAAVQIAEDAVGFWELKVSAAEAALAPIETEALRAEVQSGLAARVIWLENLSAVLGRVIENLPAFREAVTQVREGQAFSERARSELEKRGSRPERLPEDETAAFVLSQLGDIEGSAALSALVALAKFLGDAPRREAERAEAKRREEADIERSFEDAALQGLHGEEERARVYKKRKALLEGFYGPKGPQYILTSVKGTAAQAELERIRKNAGLK
jgi:hypothetical protein